MVFLAKLTTSKAGSKRKEVKNVQRGVTVIPKSTRQERIEENFAIWDFSLTDNEMAQINALDLGYVGEAVKHFNPEFVRGCLGVKIHD